jgi:hypothetical protein
MNAARVLSFDASRPQRTAPRKAIPTNTWRLVKRFVKLLDPLDSVELRHVAIIANEMLKIRSREAGGAR